MSLLQAVTSVYSGKSIQSIKLKEKVSIQRISRICSKWWHSSTQKKESLWRMLWATHGTQQTAHSSTKMCKTFSAKDSRPSTMNFLKDLPPKIVQTRGKRLTIQATATILTRATEKILAIIWNLYSIYPFTKTECQDTRKFSSFRQSSFPQKTPR